MSQQVIIITVNGNDDKTLNSKSMVNNYRNKHQSRKKKSIHWFRGQNRTVKLAT